MNSAANPGQEEGQKDGTKGVFPRPPRDFLMAFLLVFQSRMEKFEMLQMGLEQVDILADRKSLKFEIVAGKIAGIRFSGAIRNI